MLKHYFATIREMLRIDPPTILGHLDLVKKFNGRSRFFPQDAPWYLAEVEQTVEVLAKSGVLLEVNTAPLYRGLADEPYPSALILEICRRHDVQLILNSDAHAPEFLDGGYEQALDMIRNCGYDTLFELDSTGRPTPRRI